MKGWGGKYLVQFELGEQARRRKANWQPQPRICCSLSFRRSLFPTSQSRSAREMTSELGTRKQPLQQAHPVYCPRG